MSGPSAPPVVFSRHGDVGVVSLCDVQRHNVMSPEMVFAICTYLDKTRNGPDAVRAIVLTSQTGIFCAGGDVRAFVDQKWFDDPAPSGVGENAFDLFDALARESRPILAAINGKALGGGLELALFADIVVAAPEASFSLPELDLGLVPSVAVALLPDLIGWRPTLDLIMSRRQIGAQEAKDIRLITQIVPLPDLLPATVALAADLVSKASPGAIRAVRHARLDGWYARARLVLDRLVAAEREEGLGAFIQKRRPYFDPFWLHQRT